MNRIYSLKGAVDGLADAGLFENDRGVQWGPVRHGGIDSVSPHVDLLIISTEPGAAGVCG